MWIRSEFTWNDCTVENWWHNASEKHMDRRTARRDMTELLFKTMLIINKTI